MTHELRAAGRKINESEAGIADDTSAIARSIARIAQIQQIRRQCVPSAGNQQAVERTCITRLMAAQTRPQIEHLVNRCAVERTGIVVAQKMEKIAAEHEQGFGTAPQLFKYFRPVFVISSALSHFLSYDDSRAL